MVHRLGHGVLALEVHPNGSIGDVFDHLFHLQSCHFLLRRTDIICHLYALYFIYSTLYIYCTHSYTVYIISSHLVWCHVMSYHIFHITSHHITSHHITSHHIISYHIISHDMLGPKMPRIWAIFFLPFLASGVCRVALKNRVCT